MSGAAAKVDATKNLLSIGQVLARLNPEFPELTPSKLRFLEEQQLVRPARTESGYRKFSPEDVERLRAVLTLQRDQYLPLKVIREYFEQRDGGLNPELPGGAAGATSFLPQERHRTRAELVREAGVPMGLLQEAVAAGLLAPAEPYLDDALVMLRTLGELQRIGIEPRHLRGFKASAEREVGLIEGALQPLLRRNDAASASRAAELAKETAAQLDVVRAALLRGALSAFLNDLR